MALLHLVKKNLLSSSQQQMAWPHLDQFKTWIFAPGFQPIRGKRRTQTGRQTVSLGLTISSLCAIKSITCRIGLFPFFLFLFYSLSIFYFHLSIRIYPSLKIIFNLQAIFRLVWKYSGKWLVG